MLSLCRHDVQFTKTQIQRRCFSLKANRFKKNKGCKLETRKSWVQPRNFKSWWLRRRKKLLYRKYMQQREIVLADWPKDDAPVAVKTCSDARTESLVRRFPNLGVYSQKSESVRLKGCLSNWNKNNTTTHPGEFRRVPKHYQIFHMLHFDLIKQHPTTQNEVDWSFKPGDVVELEMYTSLKKGTTHTISGLIMERRQKGFDSGLVIRNTEKDGLAVLRHIPIYSPWLKGLKIMHRYNHFKLEHLNLLKKNFPDIWNPEEVHERLEVIKQDIVDKRKHAVLINTLKMHAASAKAVQTSTVEDVSV